MNSKGPVSSLGISSNLKDDMQRMDVTCSRQHSLLKRKEYILDSDRPGNQAVSVAPLAMCMVLGR